MKPLYKINANLVIDNNLWVCVNYFLKETTTFSKPFTSPLPAANSDNSIIYGINKYGFIFKKNAGNSVINFYGVNASGSNLSNGIYVYTLKANYPYVFRLTKDRSSLIPSNY